MEVNTGDEEGGSKKVKLTFSHDDEQFGLLLGHMGGRIHSGEPSM